jgi:hypothetical protein
MKPKDIVNEKNCSMFKMFRYKYGKQMKLKLKVLTKDKTLKITSAIAEKQKKIFSVLGVMFY